MLRVCGLGPRRLMHGSSAARLRPAYACACVRVCPKAHAARGFSTSPQHSGKAPAKQDDERFVKQRKKYTGEMSEMRKVWAKEFKERAELERQRAAAERQRIQLEKAQRYRQKMIESAKRQAELQKRREQALELRRAKEARKAVLRQEVRERQQQTYQNLLSAYAHESPSWISEDRVESLVTPALFGDKPTTTGFVTRTSDYWRYECGVWDRRRPSDTEQDLDKAFPPQSSFMDVIRKNAERRAAYRLFVADLLKNKPATGQDRELFDEIVEGFASDMYEQDGGDEENPYDAEREVLKYALKEDSGYPYYSSATLNMLSGQASDISPTAPMTPFSSDIFSSLQQDTADSQSSNLDELGDNDEGDMEDGDLGDEELDWSTPKRLKFVEEALERIDAILDAVKNPQKSPTSKDPNHPDA